MVHPYTRSQPTLPQNGESFPPAVLRTHSRITQLHCRTIAQRLWSSYSLYCIALNVVRMRQAAQNGRFGRFGKPQPLHRLGVYKGRIRSGVGFHSTGTTASSEQRGRSEGRLSPPSSAPALVLLVGTGTTSRYYSY